MKKILLALILLAGCASIPSASSPEAAVSSYESDEAEQPAETDETERFTVISDKVTTARFVFREARDFINGYYSLHYSTTEKEAGKLEGFVYCEDSSVFASLKDGDAVEAGFIKVNVDFGDKQMICTKVLSLTPVENDFYDTDSRTLDSFIREMPEEIELHYYTTTRQDGYAEDTFWLAKVTEPQDIEDFLKEMEAITIYRDALPVYGAGIPFHKAVFTYADGSTYEISECLMVYPGGTAVWDEYGYADGQEALFSTMMREFAEGRSSVTIEQEEYTY